MTGPVRLLAAPVAARSAAGPDGTDRPEVYGRPGPDGQVPGPAARPGGAAVAPAVVSALCSNADKQADDGVRPEAMEYVMSSTAQVTVERRIAAPAGRVWEALTDIERGPEVISGIDRIEMLSEGPFGVGTRWRETRTMLGKEATEEMWVTASEPPGRCVIEAASRGVHYTSEFLLTPAGDASTDVRLTFGSRTEAGGVLKGAVMNLLGRLSSRAVSKALAKDLADIAASVESPQRSGS